MEVNAGSGFGGKDRQVWRWEDNYECAELNGVGVAEMASVEAGMDEHE